MIGNEEEYTPERKNGIFRYITPNLDAHNKSLEWIESERKRIGAEIDKNAAKHAKTNSEFKATTYGTKDEESKPFGRKRQYKHE